MLSNSEFYTYQAYGLIIESSTPLPELVGSDGEPDIRIRFGELSEEYLDEVTRAGAVENQQCRVRVSDHAVAFHWPVVGKFLITDGCEVTVDLTKGALEDDLTPFLMGPVMIILLMQRSFFVLHGSSLRIDGGRAVVFIGAQGYGKSTLAACMHVRGHHLLSDDVVPVYFSDGQAFTLPGYPRIKLYADSVEAAGGIPKTLPYIHRLIKKHSFSANQLGVGGPVPIAAVYVLREDDQIDILKLERTIGFMELVAFTHANHHLRRLKSECQHFEQAQRFVRTVPLFALNRPHSFVKMEQVCAMLEEHVRQTIG